MLRKIDLSRVLPELAVGTRMNLDGADGCGARTPHRPHVGCGFFGFCEPDSFKTGIVINEAKRSMLVSRLSRRLRDLGLRISKLPRPARLPRRRRGTRCAFISAITTNVTSFFREPGHFDALANMVPKLQRVPRAGDRIRIWSAGCSSGEEPYSIAMTLKENWPTMARPTSGSLQPTSIPAWSPRPAAVSTPHSKSGRIPSPILQQSTSGNSWRRRIRRRPALRQQSAVRGAQPPGPMAIQRHVRRHLLPQRRDLFRRAHANGPVASIRRTPASRRDAFRRPFGTGRCRSGTLLEPSGVTQYRRTARPVPSGAGPGNRLTGRSTTPTRNGSKTCP
jgi:hypothetical protein